MKEKALLIGVNKNNQDFDEEMIELENLVISLELEIAGKIIQNLNEINRVFYVGTGKIDEIKEYIEENEIDVVVVNAELSPLQQRKLEKEFKVNVIDRTNLILEIFATRARTKEAKIQVELAYLQFMLPRLVGSYSALDRQRGGKNKGLGEKKLELDRRRIEGDILKYKKELTKIEKQRENKNKRKNTSMLPKVSLVGYTNAGKSTLMNLFIDLYVNDDKKRVVNKDMLFTTLDTTSRRIELEDEEVFILSDTVGFVSSLPTLLIESFKSTLREILEADLLINVIDFSSDNYERQKEITLKTLESIGAQDIPIIHVYNKIDLASNNIFRTEDDSVYMSATNREGMDKLISMIKEKLFGSYRICTMFIPYNESHVFGQLSNNAKIFSKIEQEKGIEVRVRCSKIDYERFKKYLVGGNDNE